LCAVVYQNVSGDVVRSAAGCAYDIFHYIYPIHLASHDGMKFSTPDMDNDIAGGGSCSAYYGGGWWFNKCGLFLLTMKNPNWYCPPLDQWYRNKSMRLMIKLQ